MATPPRTGVESTLPSDSANFGSECFIEDGNVFGWLFKRPPAVPATFTIVDAYSFLDGGSTSIVGKDENSQDRRVKLTQHQFPQRGEFGRLYLDLYRVPRRSEMERNIVQLLKTALNDLKQRLRDKPSDPEPRRFENMTDRGLVLIGSDDIAEIMRMSADERLVHYVADVLAYIESDYYGEVTN